MHVAFALLTILTSWKYADWKRWRQYHATMLYMFAAAMLYEFFTQSHPLWRFKPDILLQSQQVVLLYAIVTMPLTVFMFLSQYPEGIGARIRFYLMWIGLYVVGELILVYSGRIYYKHTWSIWWSVLFDAIMFPMLRLHYKRPGIAYIISCPIIVFFMLCMRVPFH